MEFLFPTRAKKLNQSDLRYQIRDDEIYGPNSKLKYKGRIVNRRNPLPSELFTFYHLQVLDLSAKSDTDIALLDFIPVELFRLRNLKVLNIDCHQIRKIPNEIGSLTQLEILTLTKNKLTKLPSTFSKLVSLKYLHISQNIFEQFPEVICQLKSLTFLDLSFNKIYSIPNEISHLASEIQTLILFENKIEHLPSSLCDLVNLRTLWLGNNKLRRLPHKFYQLKKLDWSKRSHLANNCLSGNPIEFPSDKVLSLGLVKIFKFLQDESDSLCENDEEYNDYAPANSIDIKPIECTEIRIPNALIIDDLDDEY